jgi:hypothetical protein
MANIAQERKALLARILEGPGEVSHSQRRAAFENTGLAEPLCTLIEKVAKHAFRITDQDIAVAKASGPSEDQIFELVVCGAIGQATRQNDAALAALDAAAEGNGHAPRDPR